MTVLTGAQVRRLKSLAHHLKPLVLVGQKGVTDSLVTALKKALDDHELIKVKFIDFKDEKKDLAGELAEKSDSALVSMIGNIATFYREQKDPEKRRIHI